VNKELDLLIHQEKASDFAWGPGKEMDRSTGLTLQLAIEMGFTFTFPYGTILP
jgi:hypothetical protein